MREAILLKCGEMVLKGLNHRMFEDRVLSDLRRRLRGCGKYSMYFAQSTITIEPEDDEFDSDRAADLCKKTFGLVSVCRAAVCEKKMDAVYETAPAYLEEALLSVRTFKVEAKRSDKRFPLNSMEIMRELGAVLLERFPHLAVDVHEPDYTVYVEIRDRGAFIHGPASPGAGGMPAGINGKAAILISGGIDSPVAAWQMARRGLSLHGVHFFSYPYTSPQALEKVKTLLGIVARYCGPIPLTTVPFTHIQEAIRDHCQEELFTLIMRRFMMRLSQSVAEQYDCQALITGESLGQVASQTLPAIAVTEEVCHMPVFRPLIGSDKTDIIAVSRKIGTFETSIEPYEDCCTVFTPKHPRTRPTLGPILGAESGLDIEALCAEALAGAETHVIRPLR